MNTYYVHHTMKHKKPIPLNGSKCHLVLLSSVNVSKIYYNKLCYYMYMYKVRTACKREILDIKRFTSIMTMKMI